MGERRFALDAILSQDPAGTLLWLRAEASAWETRHRRWRVVTGPIAEFWEARASAASVLLRVLAAEAGQ